MIEYPGSCYCASIGFRYRTAISPQDWSIRACQCRFCVAHDALSTSDPGGELNFAAGHFGIINTHALDTIPDNIAAVAPTTYDSENTADRVERRAQRWTPVVAE